MHIQTPPTFNPDEKLKSILDLLSSVDFGNMRLAWEIRDKVSDGTVELMRDLGIIHCTDISREMPAVDSDILYILACSVMESIIYTSSMMRNY